MLDPGPQQQADRPLTVVPTSTGDDVNKQTIASLTGLRFYAAFAVFLSHMYHFDYFGLQGPLVIMLSSLGHLGVSLFYVLSGFVLLIRYHDSLKTKAQLKRFYVARLARIYPAYLVTLLLAIPMELFSSSRHQLPLSLGTGLSLTHCLLPQTCGRLNDVGWSIGVEAAFYVLFPLLLACISKPGKLFLVMMTLFVYVVGMQMIWPQGFYGTDRFFLIRTPEFLLGMLAGWMYLQPGAKRLPFMDKVGWWVTLLSIWLLATPFIAQWLGFEQQYYLFYMAPAALLIYLLASCERRGQVLTLLASGVAVFGGEISYSFYLTHNLLLRYMEHGLAIVGHMNVATISVWVQLTLALVALVSSLAGSVLLYRYVEQPGRKKLRQLLR